MDGKKDEFIRLYLAQVDAIEGMKSLAPESIDVIVTSPPYNLGIPYGAYADRMQRVDYLDWTSIWLAGAERVLKGEGSLFFNFSSPPSDRRLAHDVLERTVAGFELQNEIHWIKSIALGGTTHGHFKPINSPRYLNDCHEYVWHLTKTGRTPLDRTAIGVPYMDESNLRRWTRAAEGRHCRGNTWFIPYETIQRKEERGHPAIFPLDLALWCLKLHGLPVQPDGREIAVLDPFVGSGTTLLAAGQLGLLGIGFDVDLEYLEGAARRIQASGQSVAIGERRKE